MGRGRWAVLALYAAALFASIPRTRPFVLWANARFGPQALVVAALAVVAPVGGVMAWRLRRTSRPFPGPHLALAAIAIAAAAAARLLASSPAGMVHLPQYGLLGVLAGRAIGAETRAALGGGVAGAAIGLLDELVQGVTPGRVFDWWDVALNAAASLLGAFALAWWRWTAETRR